ncbi:MAG: condensation domain-containing protein [Bacteroidales bacterium]|jgi:NRPS condensation-like uncharacterized protein|nr:condensation domain-containing protein [Bacteroidales bacterium]
MCKNEYMSTPLDWFNFTAQNHNSNALIQYIVKVKKGIDFELLTKAVNKCLDIDPLLGCTFTTGKGKPVWTAGKADISGICKRYGPGDKQDCIQEFLSERIDASKEIPVKIASIENGEHIMIVKLHHALCDAAGALEFVKLLSEVYSGLEKGKPIPKTRTPERSTDAFFEYFGIKDKAAFDPSKLDMESTWGTPAGDSSSEQSFRLKTMKLSPGYLEKIKKYSAKNDTTLNATLTAAYYSTLVRILKPADKPREIQFTANLRRYSNEKEMNTLCNLSSILNAHLPACERFSDLSRNTCKAIKKALEPGNLIQSVLSCDLLETVGYTASEKFYADDWTKVKDTGLCTPMISNVGLLDKEKITFGHSEVTDMLFVPPAFTGPSFMLAVSTFADEISISSAYYSPSTGDGFVSSLLNGIREILDFEISG